jgi:endonuclease III
MLRSIFRSMSRRKEASKQAISKPNTKSRPKRVSIQISYDTEPPENWEKIWEKIAHQRKQITAPVDTMGAASCHDEDIPEKVRRFQTLVGVMLSTQTRDQVSQSSFPFNTLFLD